MLPCLREQPELARVAQYIEASMQQTPLDEEEEHGVQWEEEFVDLVESDQWLMVTADGKRRPILVPIFFANNEIVWRDRVES